MKNKTIKKLSSYLGSTTLSNIIAIITLIVTIIFGALAYFFPQSQVDQTKNKFGLNGVAIGIFIILIIVLFINMYFSKKSQSTLNKYKVIKILSDLQNKYILEPEFKTSNDHSYHSREKDLNNQGEARILTNSLNYDIFYCDSIANNIISGAKYVYVLPKEFQAINDLKSYIGELYSKLYDQLSPINNNNPVQTANSVIDKLSKNLEFWFFDKDVLCLYNFARFNQIGNPNFLQSWWYVNPIDHNDASYMLAHEIENEDQEKLNVAFEILHNLSKVSNGKDIYENRDRLNIDYLDGGRYNEN